MKIFPHCSAKFPCLLMKGSKKNESVPQPGMQWRTFWEKVRGYKMVLLNGSSKWFFYKMVLPAVDAFASLPFLPHPHAHLSSVQNLSGTFFSSLQPLPCSCPPACSHHYEHTALPDAAHRSPSLFLKTVFSLVPIVLPLNPQMPNSSDLQELKLTILAGPAG